MKTLGKDLEDRNLIQEKNKTNQDCDSKMRKKTFQKYGLDKFD